MRFARLLMSLLPALLLLSGAGQPDVRYVVQSGSRFAIDGTSTLGRYRCETAQVAGSGVARGAATTRVAATILVPVRAFDCGRDAMNRDFYRALQAEAHPTIRIKIASAALLDRSEGSVWRPVRAEGTLRLAGTERTITIEAEGQRVSSNEVRVRGAYALDMTDYGIDPPSGLLGLVRAHDRVVASFDVVAKAE